MSGEMNPSRSRRGGEALPVRPDDRVSAAKKYEEVEQFISTTGLRRWFAKIVFEDEITRIYRDESNTQHS